LEVESQQAALRLRWPSVKCPLVAGCVIGFCVVRILVGMTSESYVFNLFGWVQKAINQSVTSLRHCRVQKEVRGFSSSCSHQPEAVVADCLPMPQRSVVDSKVLRDSIVNHRRECGNGLADASNSAVAPPCCPQALCPFACAMKRPAGDGF
jgi:hypothetical protein